MSDLQFNTQPDEFGRPPQAPQGSDFTGKIIEWGLASDRTQAQYVLIGAGVLILALAYILYQLIGGGSSTPPPPPVTF